MITIRNTRSQTITAHVVLNGGETTVTLGPGSTRDVDALMPVSEAYVRSGVLKIIGGKSSVTPAPVAQQPVVPSVVPPKPAEVKPTAAPATNKKNESGSGDKK